MPVFSTLSAKIRGIHSIKRVCESASSLPRLPENLTAFSKTHFFSRVISLWRNDCTCYGRRPPDGKTPAVSRASAEAASAVCSLSPFQNTAVGGREKDGRWLRLRSLSLSFAAATPTLFCVPHRVALLLLPDAFCFGTSSLRGFAALKKRHLMMLGFDRFLVRSQ